MVNKRLLKKLAGIVHRDAGLDVRGIAIEVVAELADLDLQATSFRSLRLSSWTEGEKILSQ